MREKRLVILFLVLALSDAAIHIENEIEYSGECESNRSLKPRPHSVSISEFGAVGDGKTVNTLAFQNAIFYLKSFADKGGAQLYVPEGRWLTGSFNLTSHLTLFLEKEAIILGSQEYAHWDVLEPLPSYGRGIEHEGGRYRSLITGYNLTDVVITGDNGTIDGQGCVWWELFNSHSLNYSRPHLVEFISSKDVVISNLTFSNPPAWNIHPVYCSNVLVQNITAHSPPGSPYTSGIVPDSCEHVCIEKSNISMGHDAIVLKSGWDEYGIAFAKPTSSIHIRHVRLQSCTGSGLAFGSEMSGGISNILAEQLYVHDSFSGVKLKTSRGRGGYIKDVLIQDVEMENVVQAIGATGECESHPDDKYDPLALPIINRITFKDVFGTNITTAGNFIGISESPFTSICLSNISLSIIPDHSASSWACKDVSGFSDNVSPEPCPELNGQFSNSSAACFFLLNPMSLAAAI